MTVVEGVKPSWHDRLSARTGSVGQKIARTLALVPLLHQMAGPYRRLFYLSAAATLLVSLIDAGVVVGAVPFIAHLFGDSGGENTAIGRWLAGWMPDLRSERGLLVSILILAGGIVLREG